MNGSRTGALALLMLAGCDGSTPGTDPQAATGAFTPAAITLREIPARNLFELLAEDLVFVDAAGTEWKAPKGVLTDGASVPRLALPLTDGRFHTHYLKAAVVHDAWCQEFNATVCPEQYRKRPWPEVHRMFHEACLTGGTPADLANAMYNAVYWFGPRWDDAGASLEAVPEAEVRKEHDATAEWLKAQPRSIEAIDLRLRDREVALRERVRVTTPPSIRELKPRKLDLDTIRSRVKLPPRDGGR